ncbi:hypothetical protein GQ457_01G039260 [Hibiscus cannabinus]
MEHCISERPTLTHQPVHEDYINASVTSTSEARKSKTNFQMEKEKIYLLLNQFAKQIPIMKAMGMESDQEVVQMVGRDPRYSALLLPSIELPEKSFGNSLNSYEKNWKLREERLGWFINMQCRSMNAYMGTENDFGKSCER